MQPVQVAGDLIHSETLCDCGEVDIHAAMRFFQCGSRGVQVQFVIADQAPGRVDLLFPGNSEVLFRTEPPQVDQGSDGHVECALC